MRRIQSIARSPIAIALFMSLAVAGCASKKNLPNNAGDLGLGAGAATPGSSQDFTVNVGDRIFFDLDSSLIRADAQQTLSSRPSGCSVIRSIRSRSKAMPTSAARVSTTSPLASAVLPPPATSSLRAVCRPTACAPFPTVMSARLPSAMPTHAGRRTVAPSPFSTGPDGKTGNVPRVGRLSGKPAITQQCYGKSGLQAAFFVIVAQDTGF